MPEYLAPGVFVEEVSFRSKSIEGVPTSTTGFAGMTRYGPVCYRDGPTTCEPRLITSFTEFERVYGGLEPLIVDGEVERPVYLAHAARAFFDNGGKRLYVARVFAPRSAEPEPPEGAEPELDWGCASRSVTYDGVTTTWRARWPGRAGEVRVETQLIRSRNAAAARQGSVLEIGPPPEDPEAPPAPESLRVVHVDVDGERSFFNQDDVDEAPSAGDEVRLLQLRVVVDAGDERRDVYDELATSAEQKRYAGRILHRDEPEDEDAMVWLDVELPAGPFAPARLLAALLDDPELRLEGGHDGMLAEPDDLAGQVASPDDPNVKATGLEALGEIDDVAIVALPDGGTYEGDAELCGQAADALLSHAARLRYRIAVVDGPRHSALNAIRDFRGRFDSRYGALYHPWIEVLDPTERPAQGAPPRRLLLPPSGFVAGIYARTDVARGVHKAPANEVVRGLTRFESNVNQARNEVLNPEGINALRFFEGRGYRVWGARTMSSDPEWKYVNVRRLFNFVEHSIDKGTQWAVFEPNNRHLWANVRRAVEDFLLVLWKDGALMGAKPEEAFFVRCDRTTMTQNDLDNGRLICLVGVAPVRPAEFVIFRIGQWTADARAA